ncbi:SpcZ [Streptomyces sp. Go40/10]|uniref:SpcZ n=1 Tax=Streptomyces sp. Go40/10 TaxID=2825844 RepID=UPI001E5946A3|nr:SpcZ [Streptomyces sp. Go40/10]UFR07654.1 SpcZ [Streptomyces sp. Go40/10]
MNRSPAAAVPASYDRLLARLEAGTAGPGLPDWLWQVATVLYDGQDAAAARDWAARLYGELARLGGRVPFSVVHDWHAGTVAPVLAEAGLRRGRPVEPQDAVRDLHLRALAGETVTAAEWEAGLLPALREAYRLAYAYADAFAQAYAGAHAYAVAHDYGTERAAEFAGEYAASNTGANAAAFAEGNALANAGATAAAWAASDARAYAEACPFAHVRVYALAWAGRERAAAREEGGDEQRERFRSACRRLAGGLVDSLTRAVS